MVVIGYVRVSTDEQKESGLGLEAQKISILDYAKRLGLQVIKIFQDDGLSGSLPMHKRNLRASLHKSKIVFEVKGSIVDSAVNTNPSQIILFL